MLLGWLGNVLLSLYSRKRFKIHRIVDKQHGRVSRSLIVESTRRKRFVQCSYGSGSIWECDSETANKLQQIRDLCDTLDALSTLRFDVLFYRHIWDSQGGASINEALENAASRRGAFEGIFNAGLEKLGAKETGDIPLPNAVSVDSGTQGRGWRKRLKARLVLSTDDTCSLEERVRQLSKEVDAKTGANKVYWKTGARDERRELQVLTFE